jgi:predicted RNase H-like nuclease (RuvC/YqgF family)
MSDEAIRALNVVSRNLRESAKDFERHGGFDYPVSAYERIRHGADEIDRLEAGNAELRESVSYEQRVNSDLRAEKSRLESELSVKTIENFALIAKLGESARNWPNNAHLWSSWR